MNYTLSHIERLISAILALGTNLKSLGTNLSSLGGIGCNLVGRAIPRHPIGPPVMPSPLTKLMPVTTVGSSQGMRCLICRWCGVALFVTSDHYVHPNCDPSSFLFIYSMFVVSFATNVTLCTPLRAIGPF
jgi:hypothetical protein